MVDIKDLTASDITQIFCDRIHDCNECPFNDKCDPRETGDINGFMTYLKEVARCA